MSHYKILCITSNIDGSLPLDMADNYDILGADYGGENYPDETERVIINNFLFNGKPCCTFERMTSEDNEDLIGRIIFNEHAVDYFRHLWNIWKNRVANTSADDIIKRGGSLHYQLTEDIDISMAGDVVYFEWSYYTIMQWLAAASQYINKPLYVVGCVDYHS